MKRMLVCLVAISAMAFCFTAWGAEKDFEGTDAQLHEMVTSVPGDVEVSTTYDKAINLHYLTPKEIAYWNPHTSKYIDDGKYVYLWCVVYKEKKDKPTHHWIAITEDALDKAHALNEEFLGGIAFYQLTSDKKQLVFKAYPYTTVQSMSEGRPIIDVQE